MRVAAAVVPSNVRCGLSEARYSGEILRATEEMGIGADAIWIRAGRLPLRARGSTFRRYTMACLFTGHLRRLRFLGGVPRRRSCPSHRGEA